MQRTEHDDEHGSDPRHLARRAHDAVPRTRLGHCAPACGYYDNVQVSFSSTPANWGSAQAPRSVPSSGGLSAAVGNEVLVLPFNHRAGVERLLAQHGRGLAALLFEPLSNRAGMVLPQPGFSTSCTRSRARTASC